MLHVSQQFLSRCASLFIRRSCWKMVKPTTQKSRRYEDAVKSLNGLQSNAQVLERSRKERDKNAHRNVPNTLKYMTRIGITHAQLDSLPIIHVSGTKGKGSTCAFSESILLQHGLKTGLYTSPHLCSVRERIRINGLPLDEDKFTEYFWKVYDKLDLQKENVSDMPAYFKFLTVLTFDVFIREKVDVAIIEVGIGGLYDCTNVIRKPVVTGITSLGLDHVSVLGDTIDKIAWHKAGIMKPNVPAFTADNQPAEAMDVLQKCALDVGCSLNVSPPLESYDWGPYPMELGLAGQMQAVNASLAVQLCHEFLKGHYKHPLHRIPAEFAAGLKGCRWPGRSQVFIHDGTVFFLDGAHTAESMEACIEWFKKVSNITKKNSSQPVSTVLLFNSTGDRDPVTFLEPLSRLHFSGAVFCTNNAENIMRASSDLTNYTISFEQQVKRCNLQYNIWKRLTTNGKDHSVISISEALDWIKSTFGNDNVHILVTGSLHLVGATLSLIDPHGMSWKNGKNNKVSDAVHAYCRNSRRHCVPGTP